MSGKFITKESGSGDISNVKHLSADQIRALITKLAESEKALAV